MRALRFMGSYTGCEGLAFPYFPFLALKPAFKTLRFTPSLLVSVKEDEIIYAKAACFSMTAGRGYLPQLASAIPDFAHLSQETR